jgi:hypothetical protein
MAPAMAFNEARLAMSGADGLAFTVALAGFRSLLVSLHPNIRFARMG